MVLQFIRARGIGITGGQRQVILPSFVMQHQVIWSGLVCSTESLHYRTVVYVAPSHSCYAPCPSGAPRGRRSRRPSGRSWPTRPTIYTTFVCSTKSFGMALYAAPSHSVWPCMQHQVILPSHAPCPSGGPRGRRSRRTLARLCTTLVCSTKSSGLDLYTAPSHLMYTKCMQHPVIIATHRAHLGPLGVGEVVGPAAVVGRLA
jgi:hypothetical protein